MQVNRPTTGERVAMHESRESRLLESARVLEQMMQQRSFKEGDQVYFALSIVLTVLLLCVLSFYCMCSLSIVCTVFLWRAGRDARVPGVAPPGERARPRTDDAATLLQGRRSGLDFEF